MQGVYLNHVLYDFVALDSTRVIKFFSQVLRIDLLKTPDIKACEKINSLYSSVQHIAKHKVNPTVLLYKVFGLTAAEIVAQYNFYGEDKKQFELLFKLFEYTCALPNYVLDNQGEVIDLMQQVIYKYGKALAVDLLALHADREGVNIATVQCIAKQQVPVMPICVRDIILRTDKNPVKLLSMLETSWLESGCSLDKEKLLKLIG